MFHATPQRTPPAMQPRPKLRSLATRSHNAPSAKRPSSVYMALESALSTGKRMKTASSVPEPATAAAMNMSPLKKPRRAMPNAVSITSEASTTNAPQPMPNWFFDSSPKAAASAALFQPFAPIRKPVSASPTAPDQAAGQQQRALRPAGWTHERRGGDAQAEQPQPEPGAPVPCCLHQPVGGVFAAEHAGDRQQAIAVLHRIPGQDQVAREPKHQPQPDGGVGGRLGAWNTCARPKARSRLPGWTRSWSRGRVSAAGS